MTRVLGSNRYRMFVQACCVLEQCGKCVLCLQESSVTTVDSSVDSELIGLHVWRMQWMNRCCNAQWDVFMLVLVLTEKDEKPSWLDKIRSRNRSGEECRVRKIC